MSESGFIDWLVKTMLGWARWLTDMMWNSINSTSARGGAVGWFGRNWPKIAIVMIVVGIVLDWLIWMIRWRPYWLWFRKRQIIYADEGETPLAEQAAAREAAGDLLEHEEEDIDIFAPKKKSRANRATEDEDPFLDNTLVPEGKAAPEAEDDSDSEADGYRVMFAPMEKSRRHVMFEDEDYDSADDEDDE